MLNLYFNFNQFTFEAIKLKFSKYVWILKTGLKWFRTSFPISHEASPSPQYTLSNVISLKDYNQVPATQ